MPDLQRNQGFRMTNVRSLKLSAAMGVALALQIPHFAAAQNTPPPPPPVPVDEVPFTIPANSAFYACKFDLQVQYSGKGATVTLPGRGFVTIAISPGLTVKLTNLSNTKMTTILNITGTIKTSTDKYGNTILMMNGRNLVGDPGQPGLVLTVGNFNFVYDKYGVPVTLLNGTGQMISICSLLE
jgi:hypothetical protein